MGVGRLLTARGPDSRGRAPSFPRRASRFPGRAAGPGGCGSGRAAVTACRRGDSLEAVTPISGSGVTVEVSGRGETAWLLLTVVTAFPRRCGVRRRPFLCAVRRDCDASSRHAVEELRLKVTCPRPAPGGSRGARARGCGPRPPVSSPPAKKAPRGSEEVALRTRDQGGWQLGEGVLLRMQIVRDGETPAGSRWPVTGGNGMGLSLDVGVLEEPSRGVLAGVLRVSKDLLSRSSNCAQLRAGP